ncbi:MAG: putative ABC transporter permease [Lachnospiraceae bacterium]
MWWNRVIFGLDAYQVIMWFFVYSVLGWMIESLYMSICNRKLTNRGFVKGPFCPIYGVGALTVFFLLQPYSNHGVVLFVLGSFLATFLEFITAAIMNRFFGEIWWDYTDKPFNFRGVVCLESSIAWGFYTIFLFMFLQNFVMKIVNVIPVLAGRFVGSLILIVFVGDFLITLYSRKQGTLREQVIGLKETLLEKISR